MVRFQMPSTSSDYSISIESDYLRIDVTSQATIEMTRAICEDIRDYCSRPCRILAVTHALPIDMSDAVEHADLAKDYPFLNNCTIAWAVNFPGGMDMGEFVENAMFNEGFSNMTVFDAEDKAIEWLSAQPPGGSAGEP